MQPIGYRRGVACFDQQELYRLPYDTPIIPLRFLRFLNSLPISDDPYTWIKVFRQELGRLLGDVDRIIVSVNFACDLHDPEGYHPDVFVAQHVVSRTLEGEVAGAALPTTSPATPGGAVERLVEELRIQGFPIEEYYAPHGFSFYIGGHAYLGSILLWRRLHAKPISDTSIELVRRLEPFLIFVLSDLIARRQGTESDVNRFTDALENLAVQVGLGRQEQRVVILQLFGHSYKDIADMLAITVDGVRHHLKIIHRKTGTRSYTELFAKYFMPRLDLEREQDKEDDEQTMGMLNDSEYEEDLLIRDPQVEELPEEFFFDGLQTPGARMRRFCELAFPSIRASAHAIGMGPSNLQKYFNGERDPGFYTLQRLYDLGCNVNGILGGSGEVFDDTEIGRSTRTSAWGRIQSLRAEEDSPWASPQQEEHP